MVFRQSSKLFLALLSGFLPLIVLMGLLSGQPEVAEGTPLQEQSQPTVEIQKLLLGQDQLRFTLVTPPLSSDIRGRLKVAGLQEYLNNSELPELPYFSTLIVVPPEAILEVTVRANDVQNSFQPGVPIVPQQKLAPYDSFDETFAPVNGPLHEEEADRSTKSQNVLYPEVLYEISEPMYMRDLRLVRLNLFPYRYNDFMEQLSYAGELDIQIDFIGADLAHLRPLHDPAGQTAGSLKSQILNYDQAEGWRSLPASLAAASISLPVGEPVYKIAIDKDGIYEITAEQLATAGMVIGVDGVDPNTFQMLYRGQTVAYELVGNGDDVFDPGERVRFYGWAFDGSRLERQFITENVFWLWANGEPVVVDSRSSVGGVTINQVPHSITAEHDLRYFSGYTDRWDLFPNEPDAWFWRLFYTLAEPITETFNITLEHPVESGPMATVTAEFSSKDFTTGDVYHTGTLRVNDLANPVSSTWYGERNVNITQTVPVESIHDGSNMVEITARSDTSELTNSNCRPTCMALNRITVDYIRQLVAVDEQIIFNDPTIGSREYNVGGFTSAQITDTLIWDVTDRLVPVAIANETIGIAGTLSHTITFGTDSPFSSSFIVTKDENFLAAKGVSKYVPPDLVPSGGGAEWVAIAYNEFITETRRLANHRSLAQFGGFSTQVVDIVDVINQYGYGLPIPAAIQRYMTLGLQSWSVPPRFLLLVGDSTLDARRISGWKDEQYVLTDLVFEDPWQGQIPSDHTFSLLVGHDKLPDMAVGRISAKEIDDVATVVDKIVMYDENQLLSSGWMENLLFVSDSEDAGGQFCEESLSTGAELPGSFDSNHLCLDAYDMDDATLLRQDLFSLVNNTGITLLNYRGHGGLNYWAGNPIILSTQDHVSWTNTHRPIVVITGDCLDGNFTYPGVEGFGEQLTTNSDASGNPTGAAAHWGSSGLGTSYNHSRLIKAFYQAIFVDGQVAVGNAAMAAKVAYGLDPTTHPSLLASFTLQGDPAMELFRRSLSVEFIVEPQIAQVGDIVTYTIDVTNQGVYPSHTTISHTLPSGFKFISVSSTVSSSYQLTGSGVTFDLQFGQSARDKGIPRNGVVTLVVTVEILPLASEGEYEAIAAVTGTGEEAWPGDEVSTATVIVVNPSLYLPFMTR